MSKTQYHSRPNIIFILTDDQRWNTMGCAGNKIIETPNMDSLSKEGVLFENAFVTTPICAASRASIFTGLYERTHQFTFNTPPIADKYIDNSYPVLMREAGYYTGFVGKFGVEVEEGSINRMFDYYMPLFRDPYFKEQADGTKRHLTDITGDKAVEFLNALEKDKPFCLSISFNAPHAEDNDPDQYIWPPSCNDLYEDVDIPVPETMTDEIFQAQHRFLRESESRVRFNWRFNEPEKYQSMVKGYFRMISGIDMVLGRIRDELNKQGLDDNTIIIYTSDNGYFLGERGFADKWYLYEYSLRVPLIIYDPRCSKAKRGRRNSHMVLNVDLPSTMLEYGQIDIPQTMQGRSLVPLVEGNTPSYWRDDFFCEHLFDIPSIPKSQGIRTDQWTYIDWFEYGEKYQELYNHKDDFDEINNLAFSEQHKKILKDLQKRTEHLKRDYIRLRHKV